MWLTTKDGRHFNTDWIDNEEKKAVDADADKKEKQMAQAREEAMEREKADKKEPKYEKVPGLIFGVAKVADTYVDIDGYSNKPTEKGMLGELAKAVERYDKGEADAIRSMVKDKEIQQIHARKDEPGAQYICEWEDVPSASRYVDENGKDSILSGKDGVDIETKEGKWYVHCRIIR